MNELTEAQIKDGYFLNTRDFVLQGTITEVSEYHGEERLCIVCTQIDHKGYSERAKKRILQEWVEFLKSHPHAFKSLHFNSRVPQSLFDAACCQLELAELRFKWGPYHDLSSLEKLSKLKHLYVGSGANVEDISVLGKMNSLVSLHLENFQRIEDYIPLSSLHYLEQLVICGPNLGTTPVKDLEFLREMKGLHSIGLVATSLKRRYSINEVSLIRAEIPLAYDIYGYIWGPNRHT
jgi:hypothetical protein